MRDTRRNAESTCTQHNLRRGRVLRPFRSKGCRATCYHKLSWAPV